MLRIIKSVIFLVTLSFSALYSQKLLLTNPVGKPLPEGSVVFKNRSIMSCGQKTGLSVYTSLDIQAILSISNLLSQDKISLTTNWDTFTPSFASTSSSLNEKDFLTYPADVQRIIFLCLTWDESYRLKLFNIPIEALDDISSEVIKKKPWQNLQNEVAERIDAFSKFTIRDFVHLVLRANTFYYVRGGLNKNPTLWSTSFVWKVPSTVINKNSESIKDE
ncbi:hypothetical protein QEJ31_08030 [Pigmentibacter sp. JX0631]|uniref:hypothetical protein n=1 Tax=Pigmentibacter sp. JX0631 TaxID=2976982 RepID=UPI002468CF45|nr:hypothetical protein [Pigmentibacter sp. JX0631]WGL58488.1 hypothetical protein QEJ31_08030 [Pigmentibacter sp. JX0631]